MRDRRGKALSLPDANGGPWVTLSRFHPRPQDMPALTHSAASYQVVTVSGWVHLESRADQRRIPIQMLAEGSVFGSAPSQPAGDVVDVRPLYYANPDGDVDHPVWRYGLAFPGGHKGPGGRGVKHYKMRIMVLSPVTSGRARS
ncbi:MAG: hypothetical protein M5R40_20590 [Anaerolineae bacterium]|nr:hypothetical protein [Anaerolineae bacterium]